MDVAVPVAVAVEWMCGIYSTRTCLETACGERGSGNMADKERKQLR